jgi:hypothetical protein
MESITIPYDVSYIGPNAFHACLELKSITIPEGVRDILANQTASVQRILDQLCQDKIDAKNEKIADLQRELSMKDLQASQIAQNAFISQGFANEVDALYNRLSNCPVPSTPVYGRTPIFTCPNNNGCGCNGFNNLI